MYAASKEEQALQSVWGGVYLYTLTGMWSFPTALLFLRPLAMLLIYGTEIISFTAGTLSCTLSTQPLRTEFAIF